jgi:hypothetical protein
MIGQQQRIKRRPDKTADAGRAIKNPGALDSQSNVAADDG